MSASSVTRIVVHELARELYVRRLLLQLPIYHSSINSPPPTANSSPTNGEPYGQNGFDASAVMVLSVILCALVCSLGLNSIVRCALKCSHLLASQSASNTRIGNTGMKKKEIKTIPALNYSNGLELQHLDTECVICLSDFSEGERVRVLPKCNHGFHVRCIDQWLTSHSSCPTCRHSLIKTSQKKTICSQSSSSEVIPTQAPTTVPQETILTITPLDPERTIPSYR